MNTRERLEALWRLDLELDALLTPDEAELYPALMHLGDLIEGVPWRLSRHGVGRG